MTAPEDRATELRRRISRMGRRRELYKKGFFCVSLVASAFLLLDSFHVITFSVHPVVVALLVFGLLCLVVDLGGMSHRIEWYEQRIDNLLASSGNLEKVAVMTQAGGSIAVLIRSFGIESRHTIVANMYAMTDSHEVLTYNVPRDIYSVMLSAVHRHIEVFSLLNEWDFSFAWSMNRVDAGEEWWPVFQLLAAKAKVLIAVVLKSVSSKLRDELKWIEANGAGGRTIIIVTQSAERKLKKVLPNWRFRSRHSAARSIRRW